MEAAEARRLALMPSMVVQTEPRLYTYILPPIRYPDGRHYLKLGQHDLSKVTFVMRISIMENDDISLQDLTSMDQVTQHYRTGPDPGHVRKLVEQGDCVRMKWKEVLATLAVQRGSWCRVCRWPAGGATAASPSTPGPRRRPS